MYIEAHSSVSLVYGGLSYFSYLYALRHTFFLFLLLRLFLRNWYVGCVGLKLFEILYLRFSVFFWSF